ncbi:kielin/chordin-like protein [Aplochiton taeniatus]
MGVHLLGRQAPNASATLLSLSSSSSSTPFLQLSSSTLSNSLRLDYQAGPPGQGLTRTLFPGGSPFSGGRWVRMALGLEPCRLVLFVDCREAVVLQRGPTERVRLELPQDLMVTLASAPWDSASRFTGHLQTAEIATRAYLRRPWPCANLTEPPAAPPLVPVVCPGSGDVGKPGAQKKPPKPQDPAQTSGTPQEPQGDQPKRGGFLGPPGSSQGPKPLGEDRLRGLEERVEGLARMLDMVKSQNVELESRVKYLEGCECVRRRCVWEGRPVEDGQRWETNLNTVCTCSSGRVTCEAKSKGCELDGQPLPHNVSYNAIDGCQTCSCREGNRVCSPPPCPPLECAERETRPGECCPRCRGCVHSGVQYDHGAKWRPAENPCGVCYCEEGRVRCEREECRTPCQNPSSPPANTCCPVCNGCGVNGHDFPNGATIPTGDRCQECVCVNGDVVCPPRPCPALSCGNPVQRPGDCCPRCEQCEYNSQVFLDGQNLPSRGDPCLRCRCSAGEVSCERVDTSCPAVRCSHPAKPREQCCPTCDECEYEGRVYADGKVFNPAGGGPCLQCRCKEGNVRCHEEKCPAECADPVIDPQRCCPICKDPCESCTYQQRVYANGQTFTAPDQPCHVCTCQDGMVECKRRPCPPLNCSNAHTPPGECCPKCPDCSFENRVFVNGEAFPNPVSVCEECVCVEGRVDCHTSQCPRPNCNAPLPGNCCQNNCHNGTYAGKEYPNGEDFPHPTDKCRACHCMNGNVQCLMKRCPPLGCSNPNLLPGECCPQCPTTPADCVYENRPYRHTERFYDPTDACRSCLCTNGTVHCQRRPCPLAPCSHPISQECCRTCEGCLYEGRERANRESWDDGSDPCGVCVCQEGTVVCERKRCPPANCANPIQGPCCMSCDGCTYNGRVYLDRYEFASDDDPCRVCTCYQGDIVCSKLPCYQDCMHPYTLPGQCCGECDRCFYSNKVLLNGESISDPSNPCSECTCQSGSVRCVKKQCVPARCPHPDTSPCGCPVCEGCRFQEQTYADGQVFPGGRGGCEDCTCTRGEVVCAQRRCPAVACPHPALDGCACAVCDGCRFHLRDCTNGERFPHPTDPCQRCSCLNGGVVCVSPQCPAVTCARPVTPLGQCCPVCTGACLHQGEEHPSGAFFTTSSDPCSSCTCLNEVVTCQRRPCPLQCSHPVPSEACCPACDACLYDGLVHTHRHAFAPPSNPCQRCTCVRGTVTCVPLVCPPTACARPVTQPGECCPQCSVCRLDGQEYGEGQQWTQRFNHCSMCTCQAGEVRCVSPECPRLTCMHQVTDPGACCPRCRGCIFKGEGHPEGSSWFADSTPCMTCMCVDGVTTCSEVRCLSPCVNTITVPGECCPVCADCVFEGQVYGPGDSFQPADDPCQICTCEVMPDGEQHLRCLRKQCPSLVDCPKNNILFSGPDACCPVCAQPLSNCTTTLIGNEVLATDDPCFTCQCKDLTWTCLHQINCPPLSCPPSEQFTPPDSCCPTCSECVIEGQGKRIPNGSSWTDSDDDCVTCTCNLGNIECSIEECPPGGCQEGQVQVKTPGKCCYECQDPRVSCAYQGSVYQSSEQWQVDECTGCTCVSGDVHCHSERCAPLFCATDETPAVIPGVCCPHCIPRPATCIAFGDPHYRTFDGRMLHFQGTCTYVLAQDCEDGDFSVLATNDDRGRKGVSWTKEVLVSIGDLEVQLLQDWVVKVDGKVVTLPFLQEPYVYVERRANTVLLNTNIGLKVLWSGRSHLEVSVPGSYKGHTCGLCGDFNSFPQDDLRTPGGQLSRSEAAFGNSWRVENRSHALTTCRPGEDVDPCKDAGYQARKGANARCKVLKSPVFQACHRVVPPEPWYGACVYDLCACGANADECLCDALEAYVGQCREAGVVLKWRSSSLCAVGCPVERGFVFDECGPPCPVTCFNVDVPLGRMESHCFKPCVPGCQCPAGLVLHNNYCVPREKCPKVIYGAST